MASKLVEKISLYYREGTKHDKIYNIELTEDDGGFRVTGYNGRRGARLTPQSKTPHAISYRTARHIFNELLNAKLNHRTTPYRIANRESNGSVNTNAADVTNTLATNEASVRQLSERELPADDGGAYVANRLDALEF